MKYTRSESNEVVAVTGCAKCPHMVPETDGGGFTVMHCTKPPPNKARSNRKLVGQWMGSYHAYCPLPSDAKLVPELEVKK